MDMSSQSRKNSQFGVYTTVYFNFMLQGHAHDDYDQMATTFKAKYHKT